MSPGRKASGEGVCRQWHSPHYLELCLEYHKQPASILYIWSLFSKKAHIYRTSLVLCLLDLYLLVQGVYVQPLVRELNSTCLVSRKPNLGSVTT